VAVTLVVRALFVLVFEAAREFLVDHREGSGVSSEAIEVYGILAMNTFEDFGHGVAKCAGRNATNHAGKNGVGSGFNPNIEIANIEALDALTRARVKRITHEILNGGKHSRDQAGILHSNAGSN